MWSQEIHVGPRTDRRQASKLLWSAFVKRSRTNHCPPVPWNPLESVQPATHVCLYERPEEICQPYAVLLARLLHIWDSATPRGWPEISMSTPWNKSTKYQHNMLFKKPRVESATYIFDLILLLRHGFIVINLKTVALTYKKYTTLLDYVRRLPLCVHPSRGNHERIATQHERHKIHNITNVHAV